MQAQAVPTGFEKTGKSKDSMLYHQIVCISLSLSLLYHYKPWFIYTHMLPLAISERAEHEDEITRDKKSMHRTSKTPHPHRFPSSSNQPSAYSLSCMPRTTLSHATLEKRPRAFQKCLPASCTLTRASRPATASLTSTFEWHRPKAM